VPIAAAVALGLYLGFRPSGEAAPRVGEPAATWAAGERAAPDFRLADQYGQAVSLAGLRGRRVIVTFVDPRCTTFCPREALVLNDAIRALPAGTRPAVVAVNVNPPVRDQAVLRREARRFRWLPQWRWAVGSAPQLEAVWADYNIQVVPAKGDIAHTEAAYLVDTHGDQRALFLWPFRAADIATALRQLP
jgi:cytochrome oxidase Cu insertion factor (SCO1/SenC/PrrC family)